MSISHHQIGDASLGIAKVQKWPIVGNAWQFLDVFIVVDIKCDISVTGKIGLFGSTFSNLIYQNLDYEACMLDTWSQGMSQNTYYYQQND